MTNRTITTRATESRVFVLWAAALLIGVSFLALLSIFPPNFHPTDFGAWKHDSHNLLCAIRGKENCPSLTKFPLAYLINSSIASITSRENTGSVVSVLNIVALLCSVGFVHYMSRLNSYRQTAIIFLTAIIFTVIPAFYLHNGALEVQFGVFLGIYCSALYLLTDDRIKTRFVLVALWASSFLLPLYKDTNLICMGAVYLFAVILSARGRTLSAFWNAFFNSRRIFYLIVSAALPALIILLGYNWFRFESLLPLPYIIEAKATAPSILLRAENFFWIFLSPNGGLLVSWTAALLVLLLGLRVCKRSPSQFGIAVSVVLIGFGSLILSSWWTPFGWDSWGNRLILPYATASLMVLASTSTPASRVAYVNRRPGGFWSIPRRFLSYFVFVTAFFLSLGYIALSYSWNRNDYFQQSLFGSDACKAVVLLQQNRTSWEFKKSSIYLRCHRDRFTHVPGSKPDMSPLSIAEKKRYLIRHGNGTGVTGQGWSSPEEWGVWSKAEKAEIRFVPAYKIRQLALELQPFLYGPVKRQRIVINLDDEIVYKGVLTEPGSISVKIPNMYDFEEGALITLVLELPDAAAPSHLGLSKDERVLGVGLRAIEFH